jgi:zinc protease
LILARHPTDTSRRLVCAALVGILAVIAIPAVGQQTPTATPSGAKSAPTAGAVKIASVEGITEYRLTNGLRVLLFPDPSKPTVTVNITYLVGSRHESYGETGMAHLLEHLMFKGTPKNPNIPQQFSERGARWNGTTSFDRTNYFETVPASSENLRWAIELEADRMVNSNVSKKDLDSEMTVVRNEYERGENSPVNVLYKRMRSVAFDWHNYQNSPIGNRSDIENVAIENLRAFYRRYYQPVNAVLLVAGQFDTDTALRLVVDSFGHVPKPTRSLPTLWTVEPTQDGERTFSVRRSGNIQLVMLAYKVPSVLHPDAIALAFAAGILDHAPNGRLYKALVESNKAVSVSADTDDTVDPGLFTITATVKEGESIEDVQRLLIQTVENFYREPPTGDELARVRLLRERSYEQALSSPQTLAIGLSESIAAGDWRLWFYRREAGKAVTADDVARVAKAYLRRDNRTVGRFIPTDEPERAPIPSAPSVADVLKDFSPTPTMTAGEAFDPNPANIEARTHRYVLPNGMKVALLPKKTRGETVNVVLRSHYGDTRSRFGKSTLEGFTAQMLMRGTTRYTRSELVDELDKLNASGSVGLGSAQIQTTKPNLTKTLELIAHILRNPTFPNTELEQLRKQWITRLEAGKTEPSAVTSEVIGKHFNAYERGDPRYFESRAETIEDLNAVTVEKLKQVHQAFTGFSHSEIAVVGDFDEAQTRRVLERLFGEWVSPIPYQRIENPYQAISSVNQTLETPDKQNAVIRAQMLIEMREDDADFPALSVANYIFGGGAGLNARIVRRIRGKEGLSYAVGTSLWVSDLDRRGVFSMSASAAPQNIAKLEAVFREELDIARRDGFTAQELADAKSGILAARRQYRAQDGFVANYWIDRLHRDETFLKAQVMDDKFQAVTLAEVNAAFRKYIDPEKLAIVKAGDFAKLR